MTTQQFPALVFRSPGPHRHSSGGAYRFAQVNDADEMDALLAQGFHADVRAAIVACGERAFTHGLTTTQLRKVPVAKLLARLQASYPASAAPAGTWRAAAACHSPAWRWPSSLA